jgi:hypothetical protein
MEQRHQAVSGVLAVNASGEGSPETGAAGLCPPGRCCMRVLQRAEINRTEFRASSAPAHYISVINFHLPLVRLYELYSPAMWGQVKRKKWLISEENCRIERRELARARRR